MLEEFSKETRKPVTSDCDGGHNEDGCHVMDESELVSSLVAPWLNRMSAYVAMIVRLFLFILFQLHRMTFAPTW